MNTTRRWHGIILASFSLVLLLTVRGMAEKRTWTDSTGKHKIEAEFVSLVDGKVKLRKADGKLVTIPLAKLSDDDQALAKELAGAEKPSADKPTDDAAESSDD